MLACEGKKLKKGALNRPSVKEVGLLRTPFPTRDKPCSRRCLFEVLRTAFSALALRAFRNILQFPLSNRVFMTTSPPHVQKNLCVVTEVREFLLAPPMGIS